MEDVLPSDDLSSDNGDVHDDPPPPSSSAVDVAQDFASVLTTASFMLAESSAQYAYALGRGTLLAASSGVGLLTGDSEGRTAVNTGLEAVRSSLGYAENAVLGGMQVARTLSNASILGMFTALDYAGARDHAFVRSLDTSAVATPLNAINMVTSMLDRFVTELRSQGVGIWDLRHAMQSLAGLQCALRLHEPQGDRCVIPAMGNVAIGFSIGTYGHLALKAMGLVSVFGEDAPADDESALARIANIPRADVLDVENSGCTYRPGYSIALHRPSRSIVVALRGTLRLQDVLTDLVCEHKDFPWVEECDSEAHAGMTRAAVELDHILRPAVAELLSRLEQEGSHKGADTESRARGKDAQPMDKEVTSSRADVRSNRIAAEVSETEVVTRTTESDEEESSTRRKAEHDGERMFKQNGEEVEHHPRVDECDEKLVNGEREGVDAEEAQKIGDGKWQVLVTGHSLGAGVSALLAIMWARPSAPAFPGIRVQCHTFGTPCVLSLSAARAVQTTVNSYVFGNDMVCRWGLGSSEDLRDALCWMATQEGEHLSEEDPDPEEKHTIAKEVQMRLQLMASLDDDKKDEVFARLWEIHDDMTASTKKASKLYPPGNIYWLGDGEVRRCDNEPFGAMLISAGMFGHHMPAAYIDSIQPGEARTDVLSVSANDALSQD